jgi:hypothetical protein
MRCTSIAGLQRPGTEYGVRVLSRSCLNSPVTVGSCLPLQPKTTTINGMSGTAFWYGGRAPRKKDALNAANRVTNGKLQWTCQTCKCLLCLSLVSVSCVCLLSLSLVLLSSFASFRAYSSSFNGEARRPFFISWPTAGMSTGTPRLKPGSGLQEMDGSLNSSRYDVITLVCISWHDCPKGKPLEDNRQRTIAPAVCCGLGRRFQLWQGQHVWMLLPSRHIYSTSRACKIRCF